MFLGAGGQRRGVLDMDVMQDLASQKQPPGERAVIRDHLLPWYSKARPRDMMVKQRTCRPVKGHLVVPAAYQVGYNQGFELCRLRNS